MQMCECVCHTSFMSVVCVCDMCMFIYIYSHLLQKLMQLVRKLFQKQTLNKIIKISKRFCKSSTA